MKYIKWLTFSLLPFCLVMVSLFSYGQESKKTTNLQAQIYLENVSLTKSTLQSFEKTIALAINQNVIVNPVRAISEKSKYDILISNTPKKLAENNTWYVSSYFLDKTPSFALYSAKESLDKSDVVAKIIRPYNTLSYPGSYQVSDFDNATQLLKSKRVSAIIDYQINAGRYYLFDKHLKITEIMPSQQIYIYFRTRDLLNKFNQYAEDNLNVSSPFNASNKNLDTTKWIIIAKNYNKNEQKLLPFEDEVEVSELFKQTLDTKISFENLNTKNAFKLLKEQPNICIFNVFKTPNREKIAYFSKPTNLYLDMRLYTLKNSAADFSIRNLLEDNSIDLKSYFNKNLNSSIGIYNFLGTKRASQWNAYFKEHNHNITNFNENSEIKSFNMLKLGRIEYILNYEAFFKSQIPADLNINDFSSYTIKSNNQLHYTYLACSKSKQGEMMVANVNKLLAGEAFVNKVSTIYSNKMTIQSKAAMREAFLKIH